jgi:hypothetical protein
MKAMNDYAVQLCDYYSKAPKAVIAAVVVSFLINHFQTEQGTGEVAHAFLKEWETLYQNGIVPQRPPK